MRRGSLFLAEKAKVSSGNKILDAGCGVGGSAFWLCQNFNVNVIGITISQKQLEKAKELRKRLRLEKQTEFQLQDYTKTNFPDSSFDVVWAIESVCYAKNKIDFLKEAYRVLKPNGRLIVADGFIKKINRTETEEKMVKDFLRGLALDNLAEVNDFKNYLEGVGLKNISVYDETENILPTAKIMARMSRWGLPLSRLTTFLHLTPKLLVDNNVAGLVQEYLFKNRIFSWSVFVAEKNR